MTRGALPRVVLRKNLARAIRRGHPWIYRDALAAPEGLPDGALVFVVDAERRAVARGFWDARSPIAVRVVATADEAGEVGADVGAAIDARLGAALDRRLAFIDRRETDAFRWVHGEADRLPGIHVDLYGAAAVVRTDGDGARAFYRDLPARLAAAAGARGVALAGVVERGQRADWDAHGAGTVWGAVPDGELEVRENGVRFGVDLARGQKGGLFLDQRDNRALVRTLAAGRRVLNLFGYTGGFSIYAALGGAAETTTVDVAAPAVEAARRNFERNGLPLAAARFCAEDAFAFLERAAAEGARWDLVISDPPSFAPSERALAAALRAYARVHRLCAAVTAPGGVLCAASCSSHVRPEAFLETIAEGARAAGRTFSLVELRGAAACHPPLAAFPEGDYLKFAQGRLS
ncbi:MAG TPA: class I SAM-dependent rRNA methyltransferase [Polyangia bacterium]|nr:class I SAM-dependent rRNA methyltransferase [Polyangia bacterium]